MKHVALLKGGWSAEREVSLKSGAACAKALREKGYRVTEIDVQPDVAEILARLKPDVAFNALHGRFGEDGCMQGVLEILKIPYTHSGVLASALAMDKAMAKRLFTAQGIRVPHGVLLKHSEISAQDPLPRPYVVKPVNEGSSVGVHLVMQGDNRRLDSIIDHAKTPDSPATYLVEAYIPGRELTVAVLDNKPLAVTELRPKEGFYDYTNKYTGGKTEHLIPAPVDEPIYRSCMQMALTAHQSLGCSGLSRADIRYDDTKPGTEGLYLLEINTQPGMTNLSLSPEQAAYAGIDFPSLVDLLVRQARLWQ